MPENQELSAQEKPISNVRTSAINVVSTCITSGSIATILYPIDRAIYVCSLPNARRSFFSVANFYSHTAGFQGFHGVVPVVAAKLITGSTYFITQSELQKRLYPSLRATLGHEFPTQLCIGSFAGAIDGIVKNPFNLTRAQFYKVNDERTRQTLPPLPFRSIAHNIWRQHGMRAFYKGVVATCTRDMIFGMVYEPGRQFLYQSIYRPERFAGHSEAVRFVCDSAGAGSAITVSSIFNYARNEQQAGDMKPNIPQITIRKAVAKLFTETAKHPGNVIKKLGFFRQQTNIGVGTVRASLQMALMQFGSERVKHAVTGLSDLVVPQKKL